LVLALLLAMADGDADADGLGPADGCGEVVVLGVFGVVVAVLADVLAKTVAMPKALTTLSNVARQVMRDSLRRPESRAAPRLRCLMPPS
jgi:hypothetical protein